MKHIIICSQHAPWAAALSDILTTELVAKVQHVKSPHDLVNFTAAEVDIVLCHSPLHEAWAGHSLIVPDRAPQRVSAILAELRKQLARTPEARIMLSPDIAIATTSRALQHLSAEKRVTLTEKEQALLLFINEQGEASREDILRAVWGMAPDVDTHTLETHLYRLRQKWRELTDVDCIMATDKGYRWLIADSVMASY